MFVAGGGCREEDTERMTYLHFANCVALTFVPPYILYKSKL